ncbi:reverse transcriptase and RNase H-like protein [Ditylenchus destructor]|uniref:Reverse transcriptase and RNase H-like protein n=1 Tax=Ditylenchus destructor TaxID=166010 RepID=A0AAD4MK90_9BILA|nr:reverse transcriptase and RNase H-like protein [Ditylenchus destructor]
MICGEAQGQLSSEEVVTSNVAIVNASPFLLNSTVQHHLDLEATESVDDSARHLAAELKHNMYRPRMNLRGYLVNSDAVMSQIPEEDRSSNDNPKLELLAILIGTRALKFVRQELHRPIKRQVLWSDSMCAPPGSQALMTTPKIFTNRLREIRQNDCEFRFVPTALNPADLSTRGCSVQELKSHPLWWSGPDWLVGPDSNWPQQLSVMPPPDTGETFEDEPTSSTVMAIAALEPVPKLINASDSARGTLLSELL